MVFRRLEKSIKLYIRHIVVGVLKQI